MIPTLRRIWKAAPVPRALREFVSPLAFRTLDRLQRRRLPPPALPSAIRPGSLVVSGMLDEVLGLSRAARLTVEGLASAGLEPVPHDLRRLQSNGDINNRLPVTGDDGVWLMHCNAPEAAVAQHLVSTADWAGRYRIGYWAWELEALPSDWRPVAKRFHEIWAPSAFVARAVAPFARAVRVMPHPLPSIAPAHADRATFGWPADAIVFCALADGRSTFARKNPLGAALAYMKAFPRAEGRTRLAIKLVQPAADPEGLANLMQAVQGRTDIDIFERDMTDAEMMAFLACSDVLISLHRSEGFGLAIAEMLALGKPAVATNWSGNVDFMFGVHAAGLSPFTLVPVRDPTGRYRGGRWAEPDIDGAARILHSLASDAALRDAYKTAAPEIIARLNAPWSRNQLQAQPFAAKAVWKDGHVSLAS
jgi:hypothetical protein